MALVDGNYNFVYVDVGSEGRVADGGVWRHCTLNTAIQDGNLNIPPPKAWPYTTEDVQPHTIVADDAFAMAPYLLKPYCSRSLTKEKRIFNYRLSRARRVSENAFGIMSSRFRLLLTNIFKKPEKVVQICLAIAALHNFLRKESGVQYLGIGSVDQEDADYNVISGEWRTNNPLDSMQPTRVRNFSFEAKEIRDKMCAYFMSEEGSVPWQEKAIN